MQTNMRVTNRVEPGMHRGSHYAPLIALPAIVLLLIWVTGAIATSTVNAQGAATEPRATGSRPVAPVSLDPSLAKANRQQSAVEPYSPAGELSGAHEADVAYNSTANEYLVVWREAKDVNAVNNNIYGRRVSSSGTLLGSEITISTAAERESNPAVAFNSTSNEYLVVWTDQRDAGQDIYGRRVSGSGALLDGEVPIAIADGNKYNADLAYNSTANEYLVVWTYSHAGPTESDIYGRRVSGGGAVVGGEVPIGAADDYQNRPDVAYNSTANEYLVVWEDSRPDSGSDTYGQRVSSSGALLSGEIPISTAEPDQFQSDPAVAYNSTANEYLVVWDDDRSGTHDTNGQRVSTGGALLGGEISISTADGFQSRAQVAFNSVGNEYLVVWGDDRNRTETEFGDIYGQRVSGSGTLVGGDIPISTSHAWQIVPAVAYNSAANEYLVVWENSTDRSKTETRGQRVSGNGGALQGSDFPISAGGGAIPTATPTTSPPNGCTSDFIDVPANSTFYTYVKCLACRQILGGYSDGTFRPQNQITRGQIAKIVSNAAGYTDDVTGQQTYADVPSNSTFHQWIERLSMRGHMGGYACGGPGEPCDTQNRPYFRPGNNATRGQLSKIVSNAAGHTDTPTGQTFEDVPTNSAFYLYIERLSGRGVMGGYACGGAGEPCVAPSNRPYFRPGDNVTRGQASKIVANTFFPQCSAQ